MHDTATTTNGRLRLALERALAALTAAHERLLAARDRDPGLCAGLAGWGGIGAALDAAGALLARRGWRVALVGQPGAGTTTLAGALRRAGDEAVELVEGVDEAADLLLAVPGAGGFRLGELEALRRFQRARADARRRVFVVVNRLDEARPGELPTAEVALASLRGLVEALGRDHDPGQLHFTAGLWPALEARRRAGELGPEDERALTRAREAAVELVAHLERLGVVDTIERTWDERWGRRLAESLRALAEQGGVDRLRDELLRHLKDELERERLLEVRARLEAAARQVEAVVGPERARARGLLEPAREQLRATGSYLEQVVHDARAALDAAHAALGAELPALVRRLGAQFDQAIEALLQQDNPRVDLRRLRREAGDVTAAEVMRRAIDLTRSVLARKFVEFLGARLGGEVARRYRDALAPLDGPRSFDAVFEAMDRPDLERRWTARTDELDRTLRLVTRLRAHEETAAVAALQLEPRDDGRGLDRQEQAFRKALAREMQAVWGDRLRALGGVLLGWYRAVLDEFLADVEELLAEALREARLAGARVPVELLAARASPEERRRLELAELVAVADAAQQALIAVDEADPARSRAWPRPGASAAVARLARPEGA